MALDVYMHLQVKSDQQPDTFIQVDKPYNSINQHIQTSFKMNTSWEHLYDIPNM